MIRVRAKEKNLTFEINVVSDIPTKLYGDDVRLKQILVNILTNAVKYTKTGSVWFRVSVNEGNQDEVSLHFEIEDTGIGIKEEDIKKLFSEFERIEEQRNRNIEGTGLGMTITKKFLELMGTELDVKSEYGKGSVFSFDLTQKVVDSKPVGTFAKSINRFSSKKQSYKEPFIAPDARLLVVDDNMMNRRVFIALLRATKMVIDEADCADAAVSLASENHYDLIFMDHMMPGKDGVQAMKEIKAIKDGPCADTPIIVLTANAIVGSEEQYLSDGFDGFLSKPIPPDKLEELLRNTIDKSKIITNSENS
jgi:CheY-like chemotaxis protein